MLPPIPTLILLLLAPFAFALDSTVLEFPGATPASGSLRARPTTVYKPRSLDTFHRARRRSLKFEESECVEWDLQEVLGPDIEDLHTLAQLSRMAGNAYAQPGAKNWYQVDGAWNISFPFGWQDTENDGFRGHLFLSSDNSTVVLSIKGTTLPLQGPTSKQDQYNDNLLFSCCCARVDISWVFRKVCDCYKRSWRCDNTCLSKALIEDSLFYSVGVKLVDDIFFLYPTANVWLVGHSLGGALAALLGTTYGLPAVAFEAPGERLAAQRLHLPLPPSDGSLGPFSPAVTHVFHNADPIPQGACTGIGSPCAQGGYALETKCHLGKSIIFDTVNKLGWKVDVRKHVIKQVITNVLEAEGVEWEEGRTVPLARADPDCAECFKWEFGDFLDESPKQDAHLSV
ncbi:alpha/beta-hydrolase [Mycena albidolilacea]|uniref:triacylglycerol lipase n=1 Tax=Mycena albidolilacea TaxID=1033008 RepID=A0AAD6ZX78_9AGAR|nr:alpha/beta-hydrolase [Mycena albidolilacea]